ncbi:hypothetical protein [Haloarcula amylovorans]|uniref:hypothetical protein n=1 Tax=Haloarcula amylovorans TaxID=2562280 RepID=UPI00107690E5|nr:hypothetical protein [Halomicroarcula amylolytica]
MLLTPVTWLGEQVSRLRVGGRELRDRAPTEDIPNPILKVGLGVIVVLFFLDEFLILAAVFGGPIALVILLGFAGTVLVARRTERGRRVRNRVSKRARKTVGASRTRRYARREDGE